MYRSAVSSFRIDSHYINCTVVLCRLQLHPHSHPQISVTNLHSQLTYKRHTTIFSSHKPPHIHILSSETSVMHVRSHTSIFSSHKPPHNHIPSPQISVLIHPYFHLTDSHTTTFPAHKQAFSYIHIFISQTATHPHSQLTNKRRTCIYVLTHPYFHLTNRHTSTFSSHKQASRFHIFISQTSVTNPCSRPSNKRHTSQSFHSL